MQKQKSKHLLTFLLLSSLFSTLPVAIGRPIPAANANDRGVGIGAGQPSAPLADNQIIKLIYVPSSKSKNVKVSKSQRRVGEIRKGVLQEPYRNKLRDGQSLLI